MRHCDISNSDNVIDSRDVIERIAELRDELDGLIDDWRTAREEAEQGYHEDDSEDEAQAREAFDNALEAVAEWLGCEGTDLSGVSEALANGETDLSRFKGSEDAIELFALEALAEEAEGYADDWRHGATLIRESHWVEYCKELCDDIGDLPKNLPSYIEIDWDATADNLKADYTEVEYNGVTYLVR